VLLSVCYVGLQRVLQLVVLRFCSREFKELEIVVLRHELAILRRRGRPASAHDGGSGVLGGRRSIPAACELDGVHGHPGNATPLAPALGRKTFGS
jgi:hypothetical protein